MLSRRERAVKTAPVLVDNVDQTTMELIENAIDQNAIVVTEGFFGKKRNHQPLLIASRDTPTGQNLLRNLPNGRVTIGKGHGTLLRNREGFEEHRLGIGQSPERVSVSFP